MEIEIRPFAGDTAQWYDAVSIAFGRRATDDDIPIFERIHEPDRALAAYDGDRPVGTAGIFSLSLTIPGGELPMAGVTTVGVHPTHRRRGILRRLMRRQLEDVRAAGEPIAGLWASEGSIYQRFGYGLAALGLSWEVDRARTTFRDDAGPAGSVRLVEREEAEQRFPELYERYRPLRPGCYARTPGNWAAETFDDREQHRHGGGPRFYALHEADGAADGYLAYRIWSEWGPRGAAGKLDVGELLALNGAAERDLWRYAFGVDLIATITTWNQPIDSPLLLWLGEPRRLGATIGDALWLRIVDVARALEARSYAAEGAVTLALSDPFLPENAGTWRLEAGTGGARVTRAAGEPDLALDTADLAALYLGGFSVAQLVRSGRVRELRTGAAARADAMLRTAIAPWCPKVF